MMTSPSHNLSSNNLACDDLPCHDLPCHDLPCHYAEVEAVYSQTLGANYRTLAVTSAAPGEGKSTLAEALVKRAQAAGKKVLLVELNTFNPVLKARLDAVQKQASTVQVNESSQCQEASHKDHEAASNGDKNGTFSLNEQGYSVLAVSGNVALINQYREASLLSSAIHHWLNEFDCIVFDTASLAMLNQHNIPADTVCQMCDGAVLVVEAGKTPANLIEEGIEKLVAKQVNIVGTVINDKTNPSLLAEMIRETYKLDPWLPNLMRKLRAKLADVVMLNVAV
ncbi:tyrosine-protein kinase family protein [Thalassotalea euphylliae]|uniref:Tyrosine-protein kinase family protein n=1 Tax=Thalassotalea euphylliae TaxID=1655234 RepID=A0A3E0TVN7_9GAMM|nr:tyrosine-protein kinase family protein [Thalassotalea euphylliae]REL28015.1 tyrosine-protein kinase family protein [Thalassotalea euphylliae]